MPVTVFLLCVPALECCACACTQRDRSRRFVRLGDDRCADSATGARADDGNAMRAGNIQAFGTHVPDALPQSEAKQRPQYHQANRGSSVLSRNMLEYHSVLVCIYLHTEGYRQPFYMKRTQKVCQHP